jgi:DNA-binding transcriptional regulator LsrR (DeoR family)
MSPRQSVPQGDNAAESPLFTDQQLVMVSQMYYLSGMSQGDIAKSLHTSQPQVSRMLEVARQRGIVRISVAECDPCDHVLEKQLIECLGFQTCIVVPTGKADADLRRKTLAHFAGGLVSRLVDTARNVAVAGGRTLLALVNSMKPQSGARAKPLILQAMGCVGAEPEPWDSLEIGRRIAEQWQAQFLRLNTPAFFPDAQTRNTMIQLPQIRGVLDCLRETDLALVGVGTLENSIFTDHEILMKPARSMLAHAGAVGEICGHYYDKNGEECLHPMRDCVAGIELDWLRRARDVVAVVVGKDRAAAVLSGVRGGLIKSIVMDSELAAELLALAQPSPQHGNSAGKPMP